MGFLSLIPWRWGLWGLTILAAGLIGIEELHGYGDRKFSAGAAAVQERWDASESLRAATAMEAERLNSHAALVRQQDTDRLAAQIAVERVDHARALGAAHVESQRLRNLIDSITGAHSAPATAAAQPASGPDAVAQAIGGLLGSCDAVAQGSAEDAEGLADQVRGLQSFILIERKNP